MCREAESCRVDDGNGIGDAPHPWPWVTAGLFRKQESSWAGHQQKDGKCAINMAALPCSVPCLCVCVCVSV